MKMLKVLSNPTYYSSFILGNFVPNFFRKRYVYKSKSIGLNKKYFILSFDCDTEKDIEVVEEVNNKLRKIDISPSYAVPGELLKLGADVYSKIHKEGSEFLNHGYLSHTSYLKKNSSYISTLFYDQLTKKEVKNDIVKGHTNFIDVLGETPLGFRTPHFGSFQKSYQLKLLYSVLSELNYTFSSSTTPIKAMWNGPILNTNVGIFEFPVSGCFDYPGRILDSWNFRFSPSRKLNENDYVNQFNKMINFFSNPKTSGIFNIYADPSQIYDWDVFFECIKSTKSLINTSFSNLVKEYAE